MSEQETLFDYLERLKRQENHSTGQSLAVGNGTGKIQEKKRTARPDEPQEDDPLLRQVAAVRSLEECRVLCLGCSRCSLRANASGVVFGEGHPRAQIMFIGEGPGAEEDRQGRPFVGAAGQLLDRIIASAGLSREDVYIANIVKCRPPKNRAPQRDEMEACLPLLEKQVTLINPQILVLLGAVATRALLDPSLVITRARGNWYRWRGHLVMPTFHPAALLRDPGKKRPVWEDIQTVMARHKELGVKEP